MEGLLANLVNRPADTGIKDVAKALASITNRPIVIQQPEARSQTSESSLGQEGQHLADEMERWSQDKEGHIPKSESFPGKWDDFNHALEAYYTSIRAGWANEFAPRGDAFLQKVRREQSDIHVPEELIFECRLANPTALFCVLPFDLFLSVTEGQGKLLPLELPLCAPQFGVYLLG